MKVYIANDVAFDSKSEAVISVNMPDSYWDGNPVDYPIRVVDNESDLLVPIIHRDVVPVLTNNVDSVTSTSNSVYNSKHSIFLLLLSYGFFIMALIDWGSFGGFCSLLMTGVLWFVGCLLLED